MTALYQTWLSGCGTRCLRRGAMLLGVSTLLGACAQIPASDFRFQKAQQDASSLRAFASDRAPVVVGMTSKKSRPYFKVPPPQPDPINKVPHLDPWPPSQPSESFSYPERFLRAHRNKPAKARLESFVANLREQGYSEITVFVVPQGIAIVTPFEKITDDGHPSQVGRFGIGTNPIRDFYDWLQRVVNGDVGRYRSFIFILSPGGKQGTEAPESFLKQFKSGAQGLRFLTDELLSATITASDQFYSLVYEYTVRENEEPKFVPKSQIKGSEHLRRSGITTGDLP